MLTERTSGKKNNAITQQFDYFVKKNENKPVRIFAIYTITQLIEWEILNYRDIDFEAPSPHHEQNILKAILIINEKLSDFHHNLPNQKNSIYEYLWPMSLPQLEFFNKRLFFISLHTSINFLKFLEESYPEYFNSYLEFLNVSDKKEIFRNILEFIINGYTISENRYRHNFPNKLLDKNKILKSLTIDIRTLDHNEYIQNRNDKFFKGLRKFPLIKYNEEYFDVINWGFVANKLNTNSLLFDFYHNSTLSQNIDFGIYKNQIGQNYSEKEIFVKIIQEIFTENSFIHLLPENNSLINIDYYLRDDNFIFLFEYKDYIIPDSVKNGSYKKIKEYIDQNFIEKPNRKRKGIKQLELQLNNLSKRTQDIEDFDNIGVDKRRFIIFPIIVIKDPAFNLPGLNQYLKEELLKLTTHLENDFFMIHGLTIIEIDTLISLETCIKNKNIKLQTLLWNYYLEIASHKETYKRTRNLESLLKSLLSFSATTEHKHIDDIAMTQKIMDKLKIELEFDN